MLSTIMCYHFPSTRANILSKIILSTKSRCLPCKVAVTSGWRPHGVLIQSRTSTWEEWKRKQRLVNAVALPVNAVWSHRTPGDDAHFEHAQNKRHWNAVLFTIIIIIIMIV